MSTDSLGHLTRGGGVVLLTFPGVFEHSYIISTATLTQITISRRVEAFSGHAVVKKKQ
jgi:hypothetical protein